MNVVNVIFCYYSSTEQFKRAYHIKQNNSNNISADLYSY